MRENVADTAKHAQDDSEFFAREKLPLTKFRTNIH